jgi:hypothetical protein
MDILKLVLAFPVMFLWTLAPATAEAQISPGELSRAHADLEGMKNCLRCHDLGEGPSDKKCLECHQEIEFGLDRKTGYHFRVAGEGNKECYECHSEHAGRDFELVHWPGGINSFDHAKTGYELKGKHTRLRCRDCHKPRFVHEDVTRFGEHVNVSRTYLGLRTACLDCHADEHRGQLAADCTGCHTYDAWKPAPGFDHAKTSYPLTGRHVGLACAKCHPTITTPARDDPDNRSFVRFNGLQYSNCSPCHNDVHQGKYGPQCATCHNTSGWTDIPAAMFDHSKTRFPLLGLHAGLACAKCHAPGTKKSPLAHEKCADCHADVHRGQFIARADGGACEACHDVNGFVPSHFTAGDHDGTRFALAGAHLAQPCFACHPVARSEDGHEYRVYVISDRRCVACHADPHFGQFVSSQPAKDCTACHGVDAWKPVTFDHDRDSTYKLEGQHRRVACSGCHVRVTANGNTYVRYRPIDRSCKSCHGEKELELSRFGSLQTIGALR